MANSWNRRRRKKLFNLKIDIALDIINFGCLIVCLFETIYPQLSPKSHLPMCVWNHKNKDMLSENLIHTMTWKSKSNGQTQINYVLKVAAEHVLYFLQLNNQIKHPTNLWRWFVVRGGVWLSVLSPKKALTKTGRVAPFVLTPPLYKIHAFVNPYLYISLSLETIMQLKTRRGRPRW